MRKQYFPARDGQPSPLRVKVKRRVRFEEVDSIGIVWHGRYASYFEDARDALGEKYGVSYMDFYNYGVLVPVKKMYMDYHHPLKFQDTMTIEGVLHWSEAARLNYEFIIKNHEGRLSTTGFTVQMMLDMDKNICMIPPRFYEEFLKRWKDGELEKD
jgi:acyl-CoA thioester hydrolase